MSGHLGAMGLAAVMGVLVTASVAHAQQLPQQPPRPPQSTQPAAQSQVPAQQPPAAKKQAAPKAEPAAAAEPRGGNSALRGRIEQLEEQLIDMQVAIGTIESLAKTPGGAGTGSFRTMPSAGGGDPVRVESVEVQLRALLAQVERLADRVSALEGGRGAAPPAVIPSAPPARPGAAARAPQVESSGFGQTVITPGGPVGGGDAIGSLLREGDPASAPGRQAALGDPAANPKQMYETAYGYLLQQDYGAAEAAFTEFLGQNPNDALAGNAQYWLGETYFVRGQYKSAAGAFLKGYQAYGRSSKAPDSLLKLAMSLDRLGQRDAACSSFGELQTRFPQAPSTIRNRAQSERQRLGC
ncbi:MAG: tol-pal system protein YbgF [Hyphomicrobiaceae bacterium]